MALIERSINEQKPITLKDNVIAFSIGAGIITALCVVSQSVVLRGLTKGKSK